MKRRKTRHLLKKSKKQKGLPPLSKLIGTYNVDDRVVIKITNEGIKTAPHRRYHGRIGRVCKIEGKGYKVKVVLTEKTTKYIYTTFENLRPICN